MSEVKEVGCYAMHPDYIDAHHRGYQARLDSLWIGAWQGHGQVADQGFRDGWEAADDFLAP